VERFQGVRERGWGENPFSFSFNKSQYLKLLQPKKGKPDYICCRA